MTNSTGGGRGMEERDYFHVAFDRLAAKINTIGRGADQYPLTHTHTE